MEILSICEMFLHGGPVLGPPRESGPFERPPEMYPVLFSGAKVSLHHGPY